MLDILFNLETREIVMQNNDFATTTNPSVQNGGNILLSAGANPEKPNVGIGLVPEVMNANQLQLVYEMNRWQAQTKQDGATLASYSIRQLSAHGDHIDTKVSYI